ncbi:hypothetical protein [Streptomyces sp. C10]|uniref:hypothetical protein n=1 Tax=Streptomyces sp. C10 TaxID=531941 RepID=UPI00397FAB0F
MTELMLADAAIRKAADTSVPMPLHGHARPEQVAPLLAWPASPPRERACHRPGRLRGWWRRRGGPGGGG